MSKKFCEFMYPLHFILIINYCLYKKAVLDKGKVLLASHKIVSREVIVAKEQEMLSCENIGDRG